MDLCLSAKTARRSIQVARLKDNPKSPIPIEPILSEFESFTKILNLGTDEIQCAKNEKMGHSV